MIIIVLERFFHGDAGVLGRMQFPGGLELFTVERPWVLNQRNISCIPTGDYPLEWDMTGRIQRVPRLRETGPRTQINIHKANYPHELQGCIAPGLTWGFTSQTPFVEDSGAAMDLLLEEVLGPEADGWAPMLDGHDLDAILRIVDSKSHLP